MKTTRWTLDRHLEGEEEALAMLEVAIEDNDPRLLAAVLGAIARKKGMSEVSQKTGIKRESLYRTLSMRGNPEISTLMKILPTLGMRLRVERM